MKSPNGKQHYGPEDIKHIIIMIAFSRAKRKRFDNLYRMLTFMDQEYHKLWYNYTFMKYE